MSIANSPPERSATIKTPPDEGSSSPSSSARCRPSTISRTDNIDRSASSESRLQIADASVPDAPTLLPSANFTDCCN